MNKKVTFDNNNNKLKKLNTISLITPTKPIRSNNNNRSMVESKSRLLTPTKPSSSSIDSKEQFWIGINEMFIKPNYAHLDLLKCSRVILIYFYLYYY